MKSLSMPLDPCSFEMTLFDFLRVCCVLHKMIIVHYKLDCLSCSYYGTAFLISHTFQCNHSWRGAEISISPVLSDNVLYNYTSMIIIIIIMCFIG